MTLGSVVIALAKNPDKAQIWASWVWRLIRYVTIRAEMQLVATDVAAQLNQQLRTQIAHKIDGLALPRVAIKWDNNSHAVAAEQPGTLIIKMRHHEDRVANILHAGIAATRRMIAPALRNALTPAQSEAIDLQFCRNVAIAISGTAPRYYKMEILEPALSRVPTLATALADLSAIDAGGLFVPVMIRELVKVETEFAVTTTPDLSAEFAEFAEFLKGVASREQGDEVELAFIGRYVKVNILLVAKHETRVKGLSPYRSRMSIELSRGVNCIYIMATNDNTQFAREVAEAFDADRRILRHRDIEVSITRSGRPCEALIVPFERNRGYASRDAFQIAVAELGLNAGAVMDGTVTDVHDTYALVDIEGLQGLLPVDEVSWHWVERCSSEMKIGDTGKFLVMGIDPGAAELKLSRKKAGPHPLDDVELTEYVGKSFNMQVTRGRRLPDGSLSFVEGVTTGGPAMPIRVYHEEYEWASDGARFNTLSVDQALPVVILRVDRDHGFLVGSHKRLPGDVWTVIREKYPKGTALKGRVIEARTGGLFVEVEPGLHGFVPESEFSLAGAEYADFQHRFPLNSELFVVVNRAVAGQRQRLSLGLQINQQRR